MLLNDSEIELILADSEIPIKKPIEEILPVTTTGVDTLKVLKLLTSCHTTNASRPPKRSNKNNTETAEWCSVKINH